MCNKTKNKNKNHFCRYCLQCFSREKVLQEHKKYCLNINGKQNVKLKSGSTEFKNYFKQLVIPFKIYADFESILKRVKSDNRNNNTLYTEKYQDHIPCSFAYRVALARVDLASQLFFTEEKIQSINLFKQFLKNMIIVKK